MTTGRLSAPWAERTTTSRLWDQDGPSSFVFSTRVFVEATSGAAETFAAETLEGDSAETF